MLGLRTQKLVLFYCNACGEPWATHKYSLNERPDVWLCDTCDLMYWKWIRKEIKEHGYYKNYGSFEWKDGYYGVYTPSMWDIVNQH